MLPLLTTRTTHTNGNGPGQHFSDLNLVLHLEGDLDVSLTAVVKSICSWRNSTVGKDYCVET